MNKEQKGRNVPEQTTDHAAALRDKLGQVAVSVDNPGVRWERMAEVEREHWRQIAMAVFDAVTTQRRGLRGTFEAGSGYSAQRNEPYVEVAIDLSPVQFSPAKAREIAVLLMESAEAAESDALIMEFGRDRIGLDPAGAAQLLDQFRKARERRRGGKVSAA